MNIIIERLRSIPAYKILTPLVCGIILQSWQKLPINIVYLLVAILCVSLIIGSVLIKLKISQKTYYWGIIHFLLFIVIGILITQIKTDNTIVDESINHSSAYVVTIDEIPYHTSKGISTKAIIASASIDNKWKQINRNIQLSFEDTSAINLRPGEQLIIKGRPAFPPSPIYPGQFNYSEYLFNRGISLVAFIKANTYTKLSNRCSNWLYSILDVRQYLLEKISQNDLKGREKAVLSSLLLGFTGDLDPELKNAYSVAGVMHILSVSGLHVGIVYGFILVCLFFFGKSKKQQLIKYVIAITGIWFYAVIAGFSPPVVRSAAMFTFLAMGKIFNRHGNSINNLLLSAFVLLLANPFNLFDVGFQLSYAAMIGIFLLYKPLYNAIDINYWILDKIWGLIAVSLAAQIATLPFTLYYFHTFPTYFLLSNLIIVPLSSIIIYLGIVLLAISFWNFGAFWMAWLMKYILFSLNSMVLFIEKMPFASLHDIYINSFSAIMLIALITLVAYFFIYKDLRIVNIALSIILLFIFQLSYFEIKNLSNQKIIIGKTGQTAIISVVKDKKIIHFSNGVKNEIISKNILNYRLSNYISEEQFFDLSQLKKNTDTIISGAFVLKLADDSYFIGVGRKQIFINQKPNLVTTSKNESIFVFPNWLMLKSLNQKFNKNTQLVILNDSKIDDSGRLEGEFKHLKKTYFVNRQGAFVQDL
jgi:competence protein ComEC